MRLANGLLAGLIIAALVGCGSSGPESGSAAPPTAGPLASAMARARSHPGTGRGHATARSPGSRPGTPARTVRADRDKARTPSQGKAEAPSRSQAPASGRGGGKTPGAARAAAAYFYGLYAAGRFAASWGLLAPSVQQMVPQHLWVAVHEGCRSNDSRMARTIKAVTVFGNAAIITERPAQAAGRATAEDVFNYANRRWAYSPQDVSVYQHGSVTADVAAARAAGFCGGREVSPL
jgi:hypothetical protein